MISLLTELWIFRIAVFYNDASPDGLGKFVLIREIRVKPSASLRLCVEISAAVQGFLPGQTQRRVAGNRTFARAINRAQEPLEDFHGLR